MINDDNGNTVRYQHSNGKQRTDSTHQQQTPAHTKRNQHHRNKRQTESTRLRQTPNRKRGAISSATATHGPTPSRATSQMATLNEINEVL